MLKEEFDSISQMMHIAFQKTTNMINHPGEKGTSRENALIKYLRPHIPDKYEMSEGIIVDSQDHQSRQVDVIIHDKNITPFLQDTTISLFTGEDTIFAMHQNSGNALLLFYLLLFQALKLSQK